MNQWLTSRNYLKIRTLNISTPLRNLRRSRPGKDYRRSWELYHDDAAPFLELLVTSGTVERTYMKWGQTFHKWDTSFEFMGEEPIYSRGKRLHPTKTCCWKIVGEYVEDGHCNCHCNWVVVTSGFVPRKMMESRAFYSMKEGCIRRWRRNIGQLRCIMRYLMTCFVSVSFSRWISSLGSGRFVSPRLEGNGSGSCVASGLKILRLWPSDSRTSPRGFRGWWTKSLRKFNSWAYTLKT